MDLKVCSIDEEGRYGGPQRRTIEIAKAIKLYGIQTHILFSIYDSERFANELKKSSLDNISIKITRLSLEPFIFFRYIFTFISDILRIFNHLREINYDLVQINGTPQYKGVIAAKLAGIPVVWIMEDTQMPFLIRIITRMLAKIVARGIIVTGKGVYDYYINDTILQTIPFAEIHAPVDTNIFNQKKIKPLYSMRKNKKKNIVSVSGISPVKGLEYFIEMASELIKIDNELIFYVSGAELSSQKKYSKKINSILKNSNLNKNNYKYYGMIDNVPSFLAGANIFVCTSVTEAGPMTVWEAMSMGKAVVTTNVGAVSQYIKNGVSGFIVPIADTKALANCVYELIQDPELTERIGKNARKVALEKLDVNIAAEKYAKFYNKVFHNN